MLLIKQQKVGGELRHKDGTLNQPTVPVTGHAQAQ